MVDSQKTILALNKKDVLWHGLEVDHFISAYERNALFPYTSHRFWSKGERLKEDHPNYEKSSFKYGWSMTREFEKAEKHGNIVIAFSKERIRQNFKIEPIAWNFLFSKNRHHKQEKEEFVLSGGVLKSQYFFEERVSLIDQEYEQLEEDFFDNIISNEDFKKESLRLQKERDLSDFDLLREGHHGKTLSLNTAFGFFIKESSPNIEMLLKSKMFLGFI